MSEERRQLGARASVLQRFLSAAALVLCALGARDVGALPSPRARLERLWLTESAAVGLFAAVTREGDLLERETNAPCTLVAGSGRGPILGEDREAVQFDQAELPLRIVLLVQTSAQYSAVERPLREALERFLGELAPRSRIHLVPYARSLLQLLPEFGTPEEARAALSWLRVEEEDAVNLRRPLLHARELLRRRDRSGAPLRSLLILVGDGRDFALQKAEVHELGELLRKDEIAVFALAHPAEPQADLGSMRTLGELTRRTRGTFRLALRPEDLAAQAVLLAREVMGTRVVQIELPPQQRGELRAYGEAALRCGALASEPVSYATAVLPKKGRPWRRQALAAAVLLGVLLILWRAALRRRVGPKT